MPGSGCRSWAPPSRSRRSTRPGRPTSSSSGSLNASARRTSPKVAAFCSSEPDAGSDVSAIRTTAALRRGERRVGPERPEGLGDQRRHRDVHVVIASVDRELGSRGHAALRGPARHRRAGAGSQGEEARPSRLAHRRRPPGRLPDPGLMPVGRQGEARRAARPRPRGAQLARPGGDEDLRGLAPDSRFAGRRDRAGRLRVRARLREGAGPVRAPDRREPGDRIRPGRHEDGDRRRAAARLARRVDGPDGARTSRPPRAPCRS